MKIRAALKVGVFAAAAAMVAVACGNSERSGSSSSTTTTPSSTSTGGVHVAVTGVPGVSDAEIRVGGVASVTNPVGGNYDSAFDGVQAYFDTVNAKGGVFGRKLVLASKRDDKAFNNTSEVRGLLDQDNVFAVLPVATLLFSGADQLVKAGVPTFGWAINEEWAGTPADPKANLFGQSGSYLGIGQASKTVPYVVKKNGRKKVGLLAYNVPQSAGCLSGYEKSFDTYGKESGATVAFKDASLAYGTTDLSVQVQKMRDAGVDVVATCMDNNGVVTLAKEMKKQGLDAIQLLPNSYDQSTMDEYGDLFEGSFVYIAETPFEADPQPASLKQFKDAMSSAGKPVNENSLVGWINAKQFVDGLKQTGPSFDRQKLIDTINSDTNYTADGLLPGIDWTTAHTQLGKQSCFAILKIHDSKFVVTSPQKGKTYTCLDTTTSDLRASAK